MAGSSSMRLFVAAAFMVGCTIAADKQIPAGWGTCKRSDPKLNDCLKTNIQKAVMDLKSGNADLGVKPLDPMTVDEFRLSRGGNGPLNIDMKFMEAEIHGVHEAIVESVKADLNKGYISFEMKAPLITLKSKYVVRGRVLVIPINGGGVANIRMVNSAVKVKVQGKVRDEHFHVDTLDFDIVPQKSTFKFVNPAHNQESELLSRVVSENDKSIMQELRPTIHVAFSKAFKAYAEDVFNSVKFDNIFPQ